LPEISRFYGISIRMYHDDHARPHFHARYAAAQGVIEIRSLRMIRGTLPPRVFGLVIEWASKHQEELLINWGRARRRDTLQKIAPLE